MHKCTVTVICLAALLAVAAPGEESQIVYLSGQGKDDPVLL